MVRCSPDLMPGRNPRGRSTPTLPLDGEPACRDKRIAHETAQHGT
ncbi:unnamed protein product [Spirodela intermedia]|uniref:Uncharacterized protein n=1 Tax=Spirodela intermedia TaxID=51605 RepID=A0A7I8JZF6_SPIIN|nr:unnamed protein product [Spirodela intermedia]